MYSHEEFIEKLKEYGIQVEVKAPSGTTEFDLFVNSVRVSKAKYRLFGWYCGGAYATCARTDKDSFNDGDVKKAVAVAFSELGSELDDMRNTPVWFDVEKYLKDSMAGSSKVHVQSVDRIVSFVNYNYRDLTRKVKDARNKDN